MLDKFKYIQEAPDSDGIRNSLVLTLSSIEACRFLEMGLAGDFILRRYLIRKIVGDLQKSYEPCHKQLVEKLISGLDDKTIRDRAAYPLSELCPYLPKKFRAEIITRFLGSRYKSLRSRGHKQLLMEWGGEYKSKIVENWVNYKDYYAARLMIENLSAKDLSLYKSSLVENIPPWQLSRLYMKLVAQKKSLLKELKEIDPISYAYVMVKLDNKISQSEGEALLSKSYKDERVGLLLWCLGHSGLWKVIVGYNEKYHKDDMTFKGLENEQMA